VILDPHVQVLLDELAAEGGPPVYKMSPREAREALLRIQSVSVSMPEAQVRELHTQFAGQKLRLRIVRPIGAPAHCPVIVYFHGGGWVVGDATTHDRLIRDLAIGADVAVAFVDYDRAPEHRYPAAVEQSYAAFCYVAEHAEALELNGKRLAIAGDSAGGNIASAVSLIAKQRNGPRISGQLLFYPVTSADFETDSFKEFQNGPWLSEAAMKWFWDQYLPDVTRRSEPTASPLLATKEELAGLPDTMIITSENDVLRDQGEAYGRMLITAGVNVVSTRYNGTIHDFAMLNALANSAPTRAAVAQAVDFLKTVLS
jgi:acetyl esterase